MRAGTASTGSAASWPGAVTWGPQRVRRLARARGLRCVHPEPYVVTTVQDGANGQGLVDPVGREFVPAAMDNLWYGDITYICTLSGWAYLASVIDGYSRRVMGWPSLITCVRILSWTR